MKLTSLPILACIAATISTGSSLHSPRLLPLFTASINLGISPSASTIPIRGGGRQLVPITGGTISGAINATISAGLAYPAVYSHGNGNRNSSVEVEVPAIILYGTTEEEKVPYLIQLSGVGKLTAQVTRVEIEIGGRYTALADAFIIAEIVPDTTRTRVMVHGYEVK